MSRRARAVAADLGVAGALAGLAGLLYAPILRFWFAYDDFWHFRFLLTHGPLEVCCAPSFWRQFPSKMFNPLLFVSLDADMASAGLDARVFYLHQLASFALCVAAFYAVLRLWLSRAWSALACFLFIAGPATSSLPPLLMVRHYIEAIALALLALWCYVHAVRRESARWSVLSALLYLLASLAKEIALPLAFFLPLLPEGSRRTRWRFLVPHAAALVLYLLSRLLLVGTLAGKDTWAVYPKDLPVLLLSLPAKIGAEFIGPSSLAGWALLVALGLGLIAVAMSSRAAGLRLGAAALLSVLPVVPVSTELQPRYAAPAWIVAAVAFTFGCRSLTRWRRPVGLFLGLGLAAVLCLSTAVTFRSRGRETLDRMDRIAAEGRAFLALGPGDYIRRPLGHPASFAELRWLKEEHLGGPRGAGWFYDDLFLCLHGAEVQRLWEYDPGRARVTEITPRLSALRAHVCEGIRHDAPLTVAFRRAGTALFWTLGPYRDGVWSFLLGDGVQAFEVPRRGGFEVPGARRLSLKVRYESPAGWVTYSPELTFDLGRASRMHWSRPAARATVSRRDERSP